jgi:hypothetical protein
MRLVKIILPNTSGISLETADYRNFGTHEATVGEIEAENTHTPVVTRQFEIPIEEMGCQVDLLSGYEIHDQECDVGHHIRIAQISVEFYAIKRCYAAWKAYEISQVQIPMAFSKKTVIESPPQVCIELA